MELISKRWFGPTWIRNCFNIRNWTLASTGFVVGTVIKNRRARVRCALELKRNEERCRLLADTIPQLVWETDASGLTVYFNERWLTYTGRKEGETLGYGWIEVLHPDDRKPAFQAWQTATQNVGKYEVEYRIRRADGVYEWHLARGFPVKDDAGTVLRWFGTSTNVQVQKTIEQQLAHNTEIINSVVATMPSGLVVVNKNGQFTLWNETADRILGNRPDNCLHENSSARFGLHQSDKMTLIPVAELPLSRALRGEICNDAEIYVRNEVTPEGCWISGSARAMRAPDGSITGAVLVFTDSSQRKALEQELFRSNQELAIFANTASHDLQEPLRSVATYLSLIRRNFPEVVSTGATDYIDSSIDAIKRMKRLIDGLLDYSRLGSAAPDFKEVDCNLVVKNVLANLQASIDETEAKFVWETLPPVLGDSLQIEQLLQNLIGNALKYSKTTPEIRLRAKIFPSRQVRFSLKDNGIGISMKHSDRIFKIFQRLHPKSDYSGAGIGLALCKKIVERHGGNIWMESKIDEGTEFFFTLRAAAANSRPSLMSESPKN